MTTLRLTVERDDYLNMMVENARLAEQNDAYRTLVARIKGEASRAITARMSGEFDLATNILKRIELSEAEALKNYDEDEEE